MALFPATHTSGVGGGACAEGSESLSSEVSETTTTTRSEETERGKEKGRETGAVLLFDGARCRGARSAAERREALPFYHWGVGVPPPPPPPPTTSGSPPGLSLSPRFVSAVRCCVCRRGSNVAVAQAMMLLIQVRHTLCSSLSPSRIPCPLLC